MIVEIAACRTPLQWTSASALCQRQSRVTAQTGQGQVGWISDCRRRHAGDDEKTVNRLRLIAGSAGAGGSRGNKNIILFPLVAGQST